MEKLKATLSRSLTAKQLHRIYTRLEDEERPYDAVIRQPRKESPKYLLIMRLRAEDKPYFQQLVKAASDEVKA